MEINNLLKEKNESIASLKWRVGYLEKDNERLKKENEELKKANIELEQDIEKYKENEVNRV